MPSEAQVSRVGTLNQAGRVASQVASVAEQVRQIQVLQVPAHCAQVWSGLSPAVPSGLWTFAVPFDTVVYDQYGMFALANPTRLACVVPGKYIVTACIEWQSSVAHASGAGARLYKNGLRIFAQDYSFSVDRRSLTLTGHVHLENAGDYVELWARQNTGAPVNILSSNIYSPLLSMHKYG